MLQGLQKKIAAIYDLPESEDVSRFLIDTPTLHQFHIPSQNIDEQMLVHTHDEESIDVGLYLREEILQNLCEIRPDEYLHGDNFADFCVAIEGVSHFLYLDFRSKFSLPISALELELQAEVDKFVTCSVYSFQQQSSIQEIQEIHQSIFQNFHLRSELAPEEKERYQVATRVAEKLCQSILNRFLAFSKPDWAGFFQFLRRFYRQGWNQKCATANIRCG